jgi:hypothetical protein
MIKYVYLVIIALYSVLVEGAPPKFIFKVPNDVMTITYGLYQNVVRWKNPSIDGEDNIEEWPSGITFTNIALTGPSSANKITLLNLITINKYGI